MRGALVLVLLIGAVLRLQGVHWDAGAHLHPDERYLTIVGSQLRTPHSPREFLDVERSPLNPYNTDAGAGLVYGTLPLTATKLTAAVAGGDRYDGLENVGRRLSAFVDIVTILVVFGLARLLAQPLGAARARWAGVAGATAYALAPLAIQHAHFFVVDPWLTAAFAGSLLAAAHGRQAPTQGRRTALFAIAGSLLGLALAAKLSALVLAPAIVFLAVGCGGGRGRRRIADAVGNALLVVLTAYVALRLAAPYTFASNDWGSLRLAEGLRDALAEQTNAIAGRGDLSPPSLQWLRSTPVLDPLLTLGGVGLGPAIALAAVAGTGLVGWRALSAARAKQIAWLELAVLGLVLVAGAYLASRFVHSVRYLLPLLPVLCALAGVGAARIAQAPRGSLALGVLAALALTWALAYTTIYRTTHTRIEASGWIRAHTSSGYTIAGEEWDDLLPVPPSPELTTRVLPVYAPDGESKLRALWEALDGADLVVLSSRRASDGVGRLAQRYPLTTRYYSALLGGRLGFHTAALFRSRPRLLGLAIPDEWAEEVTTVYDHPEVRILTRTSALDWPTFRQRVLAAPLRF